MTDHGKFPKNTGKEKGDEIVEEKVIIKSQRAGTVLKAITLLLVALTILSIILRFVAAPSLSKQADVFYDQHYVQGKLYWDPSSRMWDNAENEKKYYAIWDRYGIYRWYSVYVLYGSAPLMVIFLILYWYASKMEITVTDKRVYGKSGFDKRVDLPLDSISAVATGAFKGLAVASSSGKIKFMGIKNRDEIHEIIRDLLLKRQSKSVVAPTTIRQEVQQSSAEELKKFKELLDSGIISQEEYNAKKKQLLGL